MRVVQRSGRRVRTALLCRRVGDPRRAHYDEAGNVLVREPEEAAGRALVSEGRHRRNLRRRILPGVLSRGGWSLMVATTGVNGLNFLFHVLISRLLGPSHYGALGAVLNVISVLAVPLGAVQLAVTQAVVSGTGKKRMSLRRLTVKATLWGAGAMVAYWLLAPLVDGFLNLKSPFTDLAIGVWIPLAVVAAVLQGALLGEMRYVPVAVATFFGGGALRLASGALLVSAGFGLGGAVAATVIGQAFTTAALLLVARREVFAKGLELGADLPPRRRVVDSRARRVHHADRDRRIPGPPLSRARRCGSLRGRGDRGPHRLVTCPERS